MHTQTNKVNYVLMRKLLDCSCDFKILFILFESERVSEGRGRERGTDSQADFKSSAKPDPGLDPMTL